MGPHLGKERKGGQQPEPWHGSSYRHYAYGESGVVLVNELKKAELKVVPRAVMPTLRKPRRVGQPS